MIMKNKSCLVTGGASGIGKAIAESLLKRGAKVSIADISKKGEEIAKGFGRLFGEDSVRFFRADVTSQSSLEAAFKECVEEFGGLDVVVNSAGILGETDWEKQVEVNLKGTIRSCKLALKFMSRSGQDGVSTMRGGVVLNISSVNGVVNWPSMPVYTANKTAIVAYTKSAGHLCQYATSGVRLLCLCPNGVDTPMLEDTDVGRSEEGERFRAKVQKELLQPSGWLPKGRLLPEEVAEAAVDMMEKAETGSVWYIHGRGEEPWQLKDDHTWENIMKQKP